MRELHTFECSICGEVFDRNSDLQSHVDASHLETCKVCDYSTENKQSVYQHITDNHPNQCQFCTESFSNTNELAVHIENEHTYECEICNYTGKGEQEQIILNDIGLRHFPINYLNSKTCLTQITFRSALSSTLYPHYF